MFFSHNVWKDFRCLWQPSSTYFACPWWPKRATDSYSFLFPLRGEREDPFFPLLPKKAGALPSSHQEGRGKFPLPSSLQGRRGKFPVPSPLQEGRGKFPLPPSPQETRGKSLFPPPSRRAEGSSLFPPLTGKSPGHCLFCRLPTLWQVSKSDPLGVRRWHAADVFDK